MSPFDLLTTKFATNVAAEWAFLLGLFCIATVNTRAQSQSAYVRWAASASAASNPSLTYNIYRTSPCSGAFVKINAAPVAATTYLDNQPAPGSYCYKVTAVLNGSESVPSNLASATILPIQPLSQTTNSSALPASAREGCSHAGDLITWIRCVAAKARAKVAPPLPVR